MDTEKSSVRVKHARTLHLPWSLGLSSDDKIITSLDGFIGHNVVVSEKMDGENISIYSDGLHARSLDSLAHASRTRVKVLQSQLKGAIPDGWRIVGENLQAKHSIYYDTLPNHFLVFAIFDESNTALSWEQTEKFCSQHNLHLVPVLYQGAWSEEAVKACWNGMSRFGKDQEGYVVRISDAIPHSEWGAVCR